MRVCYKSNPIMCCTDIYNTNIAQLFLVPPQSICGTRTFVQPLRSQEAKKSHKELAE